MFIQSLCFFLSLSESESEVAQLCLTLWDPVDCSPPGFSVHGILQARILEWVSISIFRDLPNPGIKPRSPTLQVDSLPAEPQGKPRILEWGAYPFSSRSSQPRDQTRVSCIAGGFFTNWAMREAPITTVDISKNGRRNFWEVSLEEMCISVFIISFSQLAGMQMWWLELLQPN